MRTPAAATRRGRLRYLLAASGAMPTAAGPGAPTGLPPDSYRNDDGAVLGKDRAILTAPSAIALPCAPNAKRLTRPRPRMAAAATARPVIVGQRWSRRAITGKTDRTNRAFSTVTGACLMIVGHPRQIEPRMTHSKRHPSRICVASSICHLATETPQFESDASCHVTAPGRLDELGHRRVEEFHRRVIKA